MNVTEQENKPGWKDFWANSMIQKFPHLVKHPEQSRQAICDLLDSVDLGNSCISMGAESIQALGGLVSNTELKKTPFFYDGELLYLDHHYQLEKKCAQNILRIINAQSASFDSTQFEDLLTDEHQKQSLQVAFKKNLTLITGGPGTGKTYTLARIIAGLNKAHGQARIAMAAPTGKAAQRMQEALHKAFSSEDLNEANLVTEELKALVPVTIHRLLGVGFDGKPEYGEGKKLPFDILVIDEVSMLDLSIAAHLFGAIADGSRVILLGDPNQLASVDVGGVLFDLKSSSLLKNNQVQLSKSVRFGDDSSIGRMAKFILNKTDQVSDQACVNEFVQLSNPEDINFITGNSNKGYLEGLCDGYAAYIQEVNNYKSGLCDHDELMFAFDRYRILTATKHGELGLNSINNYISEVVAQNTHQKADRNEWYLGKPIMITQNNYKLGVSNGDIGICVNHRHNTGEFEVYFQSSNKWISTTRLPKSIQTGYVMTIHKSQGSEFHRVAVVLDGGDASAKILSQELIYTAITRAKNEIYILADKLALAKALSVKTTRKSGLQKKLS